MQTNDDARLRLSGGELSEGPNPDHSLNHKQSQWYKQLTRQVAYGLEASFLDAFHQIQTVSTPLARDVHLTLNACKHQSPKTNGRENHRLLVSANGHVYANLTVAPLKIIWGRVGVDGTHFGSWLLQWHVGMPLSPAAALNR